MLEMIWLWTACSYQDFKHWKNSSILAKKKSYKYAGWYSFRLFAGANNKIIHIDEYLYTKIETDNRKSGEKQFDYVNAAFREIQIDMEKAFTAFLDKQKLLVNIANYQPIQFNDYHLTSKHRLLFLFLIEKKLYQMLFFLP